VGFPRAAVDFLNWIGGLDQNEIDKLVFGWPEGVSTVSGGTLHLVLGRDLA